MKFPTIPPTPTETNCFLWESPETWAGILIISYSSVYCTVVNLGCISLPISAVSSLQKMHLHLSLIFQHLALCLAKKTRVKFQMNDELTDRLNVGCLNFQLTIDSFSLVQAFLITFSIGLLSHSQYASWSWCKSKNSLFCAKIIFIFISMWMQHLHLCL